MAVNAETSMNYDLVEKVPDTGLLVHSGQIAQMTEGEKM